MTGARYRALARRASDLLRVHPIDAGRAATRPEYHVTVRMPHAVDAGALLDGGTLTDAAPVSAYTRALTVEAIQAALLRQGWKVGLDLAPRQRSCVVLRRDGVTVEARADDRLEALMQAYAKAQASAAR